MQGLVLGVQLGDIEGSPDMLADLDALDIVLAGHPTGPSSSALQLDPLSIVASLMARTRRVGLAATIPTDWAPFNVARALASFDHLSGGRGGWMPAPDADMSDDRAAEHLDVVLQLFDSWDDDALRLDPAAGVFSDRAKVRRIRHQGAYYTVDGPLNAPRPIQGHPILIRAAGGATAGADIVLGPLARLPAPTADQRRIATVPLDLSSGPAAAEALAQDLAEIHGRGGFDGVLFAPRDPAPDIAALAQWVAPRLSELGLRPRNPPGKTLRERLGLPRPPNRFTTESSGKVA